MKKKYSIIFIIVIFILFIIYLTYTNKLFIVLNQIKMLEIKWIIFSIIAIIGCWLMEACIINVFVKSMGEKQNIYQALEVTLIGQFANGITPFASGGQPAQLYILTKQNLPVSKVVSVLMNKFIVYQGTLVVYCILLLIFKAGIFINNIDNLFSLVLFGFIINSAVIITLIFFSKSKRLNKLISEKVVLFLYKIKIVKKPKKIISKFKNYIEEFHNNIVELNKNKKLFFKTLILSIIQLTSYFIIPYFIYRSLGMYGKNILDFVAATAFVLMITSFVPIPGASGGAEGGFYLIFGTLFLSKYIATAIVLWRLITYYIGMFIGGICALNKNLKNRIIEEL